MSPKVKITKDDIIKTAVQLVRKNGENAVNARAIGAHLNCSTQPIFSNFKTMEELQDAVVPAVYEIYLGYLKREVESEKYPEYKSFGMAYIRFAREENELFKFLFMCDRKGKELIPTPDFDKSIEIIMKSCGIAKEKAQLMHLEMWGFVHGIGTMFATSFISLEWELVSDMLTDVYQGIRSRHMLEGK